MHASPGLVGTVRNVNYEKLGEAERRMLDQEGSGLNNSGTKSGTLTGTESSSGRPPTRSDSLRGDPRRVLFRKPASRMYDAIGLGAVSYCCRQ